MGTSKKIILASLLSMIMVLGFLVGLVPGNGVRTDAATAGGDRIDMVGLLDLIMGSKAVGNVTVSSPVSGVLVKTPDDNFVTPVIPVPLQGSVAGGNGSELITFVANKTNDAAAFPGGNNWVGDAFTEPVASPYIGTLDVGGFLTGIAGTTTDIAVYGLLNATTAINAIYTLTYQDATAGVDHLPLQIFETNGQVDSDDNGIPDNPFDANDGVGANEVWISDQVVNGQLRTVLVANLDDGSNSKGAGAVPLGTVYTSPTNNVTVDSPNLASFKAAGAIGANETGYLLIQVVSDLAGAIDRVYDNSSVANWANGVRNLQPGALVTGGQYVEISLVYSLYNGTQFDEIDTLPAGLNINITMTGLTPGANQTVGLYDYPTTVVDDAGTVKVAGNVLGGGDAWTEVSGAAFAGGAVSASLSQLSIFAPIAIQTLPPVSISGASPNQVAEDVAKAVSISGVFPTTVALNAAQAAAAYTVTVGGVPVSFNEVGGVAISAYTGSSNSLNITVPAIDTPGFYDVTVTDNADANNTATATGLIEVQATSSLTTNIVNGNGTITVNPANGTGLPAGLYFTGSAVSASLVYDNQGGTKTFGRWLVNGSPAGTDPSNVNLIVGDVANDDAVTSLTAELADVVLTNEYALTVVAGAGGSASAVTPANGVNDPTKYTENTVVTVTATPNAGFHFVAWTGPVATANAATTTVTMTADTTVTATFAQNTYSVSVAPSDVLGGTVVILTPPNGPGGTYLLGTVITIQATPAAGYQFDGWDGPDAGVLADQNAGTTSFTVDGSQPGYSFTSVFNAIVACPTGPQITGITPNEAWLFGGIVARISGVCITDSTVITIGGQTVTGFRRFSDGTSIDVVIPASTDNTSAATVLTDVTLSDGVNTSTLPNGFTYKRYETKNGVNSTAFIVNDPAAGQTVDVTLNSANNSFAQLEIPALNVPAGVDTVFGIARDAFNGGSSKQNTPGIGALGTSSIATGAAVEGSPDFSLHLYASSEQAKANTPSVGTGTLSSASGLVNFGGPVDGSGNPVDSTPLLLTFPITGSGLTYGDVKNSLTMWGVETEFDYVTEVTTVTQPENVDYESEILNTEVDPALTPATSDSAQPNLIAKARIYSLNGFSLRQDAIIPSEVADGIRLATASGTASGPQAGGTPVRIISPGGGLGHIDRIVFTQAVAAKAVGGTVTQAQLITPVGSTEYEVQFNTPASAQAGIANIVIYGKADPNTPIVQLDRVFEYTGKSRDLTPLLLLLLGLLVAGLGLSAGGHSGGGGGGPCFIATAAYGTPMAAQIDTLRDVRDSYLLNNTVGTAFTDFYYRVSPTVADAVAQSPVLAATVRVLLVPVIFLSKVVLAMPALSAVIGLSLGAAFFMKRRRAGRGNI